MILSLTHFDTPATGETTVPLLRNDTPSKGAVMGDVVRPDRSRAGSFDVIFAHGDALTSKSQRLVAHARSQAGQITNATQRDMPDDDALAIIDAEVAENPDTQALPEVINPEAPQARVQRAQDAPNQGVHSGAPLDAPLQSPEEPIQPSEDVPNVAVKPDDGIPPAPRTTGSGQADTPKALAGTLSQTGQVTAYDLAAQSEFQKPSNLLESSATPHHQTSISGSHTAQTGKSDQSPPDAAWPAALMRGATPESLGMAEPTAQKTVQAALSDHSWGAPAQAKPLNFSIQELGATSPVAVSDDRQTVLAGSGGAPLALRPEVQVMVRDGAWVDAAQKGDRLTKDTPGLATSAATDGANSKVAQAIPQIATALPAASAGVAPLEEVILSRAEFQSDIGAVADQRPSADIMTVGRSDGPARHDLPRHVAAQLAEAVQRGSGGDRPIEITLNPAELGRVRISMAPGDGTIIVTILAERGETLDLMRRHADQLAQDFHDLGYGSAEFSFGQNSDGSGSGHGGAAGGTAVPSDAISSPDAAPDPIHLHSDRVDIRL